MAEELVEQNTECCKGTHNEDLCYLMSQGFNLSNEQEYRILIEDAEYRCDHCGHHAKSDANLCVPMHL